MGIQKCFRCAECCKKLKVTIELTEELREWFTAHFGRDLGTVSFGIKHNCLQLTEDGKCKIYDKRPKICREHFCNKGKGELLELTATTLPGDI